MGHQKNLLNLLTDRDESAIISALEAFRLLIITVVKSHPHRVRVDCHEGPPVPIPNTEVKLMYADDTWRVTAWENR